MEKRQRRTGSRSARRTPMRRCGPSELSNGKQHRLPIRSALTLDEAIRSNRNDTYMNYYVLLGVGQDADADTIRSAFRALARRYHPDAGEGSSADRFREILTAYETLNNPTRRGHYDRVLQNRRAPMAQFVEPLGAQAAAEPMLSRRTGVVHTIWCPNRSGRRARTISLTSCFNRGKTCFSAIGAAATASESPGAVSSLAVTATLSS